MTSEQIIQLMPLVIFLLMAFAIMKAFIVIKANQHGVVLRFGKPIKVLVPGISVITPFMDKVIRVNLTEHIPEWQNMDKQELRRRLLDMVSRDPDPDKYK